jgi:hypothetical protein
MHYARREVLDDFVRFVGEESDDDARNVAERLLNDAMTTIWLREPWAVFRSPVPLQLTLVAGQSRYAMPQYFGRVGPGKIRNLTRGSTLTPLQKGQADDVYPTAGSAFETTGTPVQWEMAGTCGVSTQPDPAGSSLEIFSDNADDTDIVVSLTGDDVAGVWQRKRIPLTGTTPVPVGTFVWIDELGKSYVASATPVTELTSSRGTVTLRTVGGTILQALLDIETAAQHDVLVVYPTPNAADVLAIPILRRPKRLLYDGDLIPDLWYPAVFEAMVIGWKVNVGELNVLAASNAPRPRLVDLIAFEHANAPRPVGRPYSRR